MDNSELRKQEREKRLRKGSRKQRYAFYTKTLIVCALAVCEALVWTWPVMGEDGESLSAVSLFFGNRPVFAMDESRNGRELSGGEDQDAAGKGETPVSEPQPEEPAIGAALTDADWEYLILVNKTHAVDQNYKPEDLADIKYYAKDRDAAGRFMRAAAADAFHALSEAAAAEGHEIVVTTAYRSYGFQSVLYNNYVKREGQAAADTYSAQPGKSEHQSGLAADVSSPSVGYALTREYGETAEGRWLAENAHRFGFILRFPDGKEAITGYIYEPWHIRYVGLTAAGEIYENGLTLEEYLELVQPAQ